MRRRGRRPLPRALGSAAALSLVSWSCIQPAPRTPWQPLPSAAPAAVEHVVFLVGDAGAAVPDGSPVLRHLRDEVERWSADLARDSTVTVLFLGDNVYPVGVRSPGHLERDNDLWRLEAQLEVVSGPAARRHLSQAYFLPGNHDWGNMAGAPGLTRLGNMEEAIRRAREEEGLPVRLLPTGGAPGPEVVDQGSGLRFVFLDTHWWLQAPPDPLNNLVFQRVERAMRTAEDRTVIMAAHHPFVSGGAHGGPMPIWEGLGLLWLLRKTGSLIQDLNSAPYVQLRNALREVFQLTKPPLVFAGGHDHSLQVIEASGQGTPHWSLVSGSASKHTEVAPAPGMKWGDGRPGYMRLVLFQDGAVDLYVEATDEAHLLCVAWEVEDPEACMKAGLAAFETRYAERLREGRPLASPQP